ncbi:hypothetical protein R3P38DRAFT_3195983 [Favolaschia claudopus]|uniref:Uncharacterized protein n=1 Tax=Favolaschia claudopus TaxID=2862362 RepID=A0AAW0B9Z4_9AGAR
MALGIVLPSHLTTNGHLLFVLSVTFENRRVDDDDIDGILSISRGCSLAINNHLNLSPLPSPLYAQTCIVSPDFSGGATFTPTWPSLPSHHDTSHTTTPRTYIEESEMSKSGNYSHIVFSSFLFSPALQMLGSLTHGISDIPPTMRARGFVVPGDYETQNRWDNHTMHDSRRGVRLHPRTLTRERHLERARTQTRAPLPHACRERCCRATSLDALARYFVLRSSREEKRLTMDGAMLSASTLPAQRRRNEFPVCAMSSSHLTNGEHAAYRSVAASTLGPASPPMPSRTVPSAASMRGRHPWKPR